MYKQVLLLIAAFSLFACTSTKKGNEHLVKNANELKQAIETAKPGDEIVMADGVWKDIQIVFTGIGTAQQPITLRAQTAGKVFVEGVSDLQLYGEYLIVKDLYFRNGYTPSNAVIDFKTTKETVASHCRVTNCVIIDFNQPQRDRKDHWVEFWGRHNQLDHCYLAGKSNEGPTLRVEIKGNRNSKNYHKITNNHFGPRPRKGGPKAETLQLGDSFSSMSPSNTLVANNYFERCNGEVEVISSKTNYNEFRNNVFFQCEGSVVTRHGNYCVIDGNIFIGDPSSNNIGGIRLINTGHWVTNNYFINLNGTSFRSPLAVMNGIPKSPLNRYNQVTDVVVAHNTWVNCPSPWQFGVGTNISQADVLPKSEIRSARPLRMVVANNIIYNENGDPTPVVEHDKADGVNFKSNLIVNQDVTFEQRDGLHASNFKLKKINEHLLIPENLPVDIALYNGFEFEKITNDLFNVPRSTKNTIGAITSSPENTSVLDKTNYGAVWFNSQKKTTNFQTIEITTAKELVTKLAEVENGDILNLKSGEYTFNTPLVVNKSITIQGQENVQLIYSGAKNTPAFEMHPKGSLLLKGIHLKGTNSQYGFAPLQKGMSSLYKLTVSGCTITDFAFVLKAYKESFADSITFDQSNLINCENGIELSAEVRNKGDYNTEFLTINNCKFEKINANTIDYYRGGYDESTIGGNLTVTNSTFTHCGAKEENKVLLNHRGIVNVLLANNTFKNNEVTYVSVLWGAKNNVEKENEITNSGKILVQQNLKLTLVY